MEVKKLASVEEARNEGWIASLSNLSIKILLGLASLLIWLVAIPDRQAAAEERIALLVGNQAYKENIGPLRNPHNDVTLIARALNTLGFKVTVIKDASYKVMDSALKRYVTEVRRAGRNALSFFYYSGHGVANPETQINYLIPVDITDVDDDKVWFESLQQNTIIDLLSKQAPNATHYVVFDACRNELNIAGTAAKALGADKGFVPVTDTAGLLIAFATAPRKTASDVGDNGGPYAKTLAEELVKPGVEAVTMFRNVQLKVKHTIGQDPWLSFPSLPAVYLAGRETAEEIELVVWNSVKSGQTAAEFSSYLVRYPDGQFAPLARALIVHFEQQAKAEKARLFEKQHQEEQAIRTAELHRLAEEQRARELDVAARQREAEKKANTVAILELEKQREADVLVYADRIRKALEDLRIAREMAIAAEEERVAAIQAAGEATKAAEQAIAAKREAELKTGDTIKLAALPKLDKPLGPVGPSLDGDWNVTISCGRLAGVLPYKHDFPAWVGNGSMYGAHGVKGTAGAYTVTGRISPDGTAALTVAGRSGDSAKSYNNIPTGTQFSYQATARFHGTHGTGRRVDGKRDCSFAFSKR